MTKLLANLGATGNDPNSLSASRVILYATFIIFVLLIAWAAFYIWRHPTVCEVVAEVQVCVKGWDDISGLFQDSTSRLWWFLAPYIGSALRDGYVRGKNGEGDGGS